MKYLNGSKEKEILVKGYKFIAGIDEAGRGSWAGPVVAAAVMFDPALRLIKGIDDSKKILPQKRKIFFDLLTKNFDYGVGIVAEEIIDEINIANAAKRAMVEAIQNLKTFPDFLLIDAFKIVYPLPQENIIKGDQKVWCIAAASIIAKVYRDNLMENFALQHPNYGFEKHKGYGTPGHQRALNRYGICKLHRKSYQPIKNILK